MFFLLNMMTDNIYDYAVKHDLDYMYSVNVRCLKAMAKYDNTCYRHLFADLSGHMIEIMVDIAIKYDSRNVLAAISNSRASNRYLVDQKVNEKINQKVNDAF